MVKVITGTIPRGRRSARARRCRRRRGRLPCDGDRRAEDEDEGEGDGDEGGDGDDERAERADEEEEDDGGGSGDREGEGGVRRLDDVDHVVGVQSNSKLGERAVASGSLSASGGASACPHEGSSRPMSTSAAELSARRTASLGTRHLRLPRSDADVRHICAKGEPTARSPAPSRFGRRRRRVDEGAHTVGPRTCPPRSRRAAGARAKAIAEDPAGRARRERAARRRGADCDRAG